MSSSVLDRKGAQTQFTRYFLFSFSLSSCSYFGMLGFSIFFSSPQFIKQLDINATYYRHSFKTRTLGTCSQNRALQIPSIHVQLSELFVSDKQNP